MIDVEDASQLIPLLILQIKNLRCREVAHITSLLVTEQEQDAYKNNKLSIHKNYVIIISLKRVAHRNSLLTQIER